MITPSTAGQAILADSKRRAWFCDLYQFTLVDGTLLYWTGADAPIIWGGHTYVMGPAIDRDRIRWAEGLEVDTCTITISPGAYLFGSMTLYKALLSGLFDSAEIKIGRAMAATPGGAITDLFPRFLGTVDSVDGSGARITMKASSSLFRLSQPFPRRVYAPSCDNQLFDALCSLSPAPYQVTATITSLGSDPLVLNVSGLTGGASYYRWGKARGLTGANAGRVLRIKENGAGTLSFSQPWLLPIAIGDTFAVLPGCDKAKATCASKFSNLAHFRGQPFIPAPETVA
jgi:uncharacterized phage protein (TIGR02218 family)